MEDGPSEERVDQVRVFLHVNGFRFFTDGQDVSISLSPFTLVRNCKFQCLSQGNLRVFELIATACHIFSDSMETPNVHLTYLDQLIDVS